MERDEAIEVIRKNYPHVSGSGTQFETALRTLIPELKESEDERIRKELLAHIQQERASSTLKVNHAKWDKMIAWLEKQGSQNLANSAKTCKDEPKFKVGDWVILTAGELSTTLQIVNVDTNKKLYWFNDNSYLPIVDDDCLHLWTIQDAKDGDVLADGNLPFIFKKIDANKHSYAYCGISVDDGFKIESDGESGEWTWMQDIKPATKEQRDLLFQKMSKAGYEWDAEKKELRKIEQNPAWSEEDEIGFCDAMWAIEQARTIAKNENDMGNLWYAERWLKSLKERCTWKPSDEQIKALELAIGKYPLNGEVISILGKLYNDLKKLK